MSQRESDYDVTVVQLNDNGKNADHEVPFQTVAVASGYQAPRNIQYVAQQTSLEDYTPGLNPLVNAAAHLLLEMVRFRNNHQEDMEVLRNRIEAEVRGFEAQALVSEVEHAQVLAARYVLCTALDESISTSKMGESGAWSRLALLSTFHNETWGGEKFFQILERCMQQPARNLYLLELMYLLLSLGFEGKFKITDRGPIALESLRDKIYRQIRLLRGEPSPDLCKKIETTNIRDRVYAYIPLWLVACGVFFCLSVTFFGFSFVLGNRADPVTTQLQAIAPKGSAFTAPAAEKTATEPVVVTSGQTGTAEDQTGKNIPTEQQPKADSSPDSDANGAQPATPGGRQ